MNAATVQQIETAAGWLLQAMPGRFAESELFVQSGTVLRPVCGEQSS